MQQIEYMWQVRTGQGELIELHVRQVSEPVPTDDTTGLRTCPCKRRHIRWAVAGGASSRQESGAPAPTQARGSDPGPQSSTGCDGVRRPGRTSRLHRGRVRGLRVGGRGGGLPEHIAHRQVGVRGRRRGAACASAAGHGLAGDRLGIDNSWPYIFTRRGRSALRPDDERMDQYCSGPNHAPESTLASGSDARTDRRAPGS